MSVTELTAVVVEWTRLGDTPKLLIASSNEEATRLLMEDIAAHDDALYGGLAAHDGTPDQWHHDNPMPTARGASLTDIDAWLESYHEVNSMPWWTYYQIDLTPYSFAGPDRGRVALDYAAWGATPPPAAPFEVVGEFVAAINETTEKPCDHCGRVHKPTDAQHSEEM